MPLSPFDLARAKDVVEELLAQLNLEAFRFEVEHTEHGWELRLECATEDDWQLQTVLLGDELPPRLKRMRSCGVASSHCLRRSSPHAKGAVTEDFESLLHSNTLFRWSRCAAGCAAARPTYAASMSAPMASRPSMAALRSQSPRRPVQRR